MAANSYLVTTTVKLIGSDIYEMPFLVTPYEARTEEARCILAYDCCLERFGISPEMLEYTHIEVEMV